MRVLVLVVAMLAVLSCTPGVTIDNGIPELSGDNEIEIMLFWGDGCPHCTTEKAFLAELTAKNPNVKVHDYEVWKNKGNQALFEKVATAYGASVMGVPVTFVGEEYFVGFSEGMKKQIIAVVEKCSNDICNNPLTK